MCAVTVAVVGATVASTAAGAYSAYQQSQAASGGGGSFTEKPLKGFAPTKGLQSYTARLLAENATAQRPTLQEYAASGGTARFPFKDTGFTPEEAANLKLIDPHTGGPMPYVSGTQTQLTPAQQVFLGKQRAREGATGPLARLGRLTTQENRLRARAATAGPAQSGMISNKLTKNLQKQTKLRGILGSGD